MKIYEIINVIFKRKLENDLFSSTSQKIIIYDKITVRLIE
jgi:hypothetical protein